MGSHARLGCSSICFRDATFDDALDAISRIGFAEMDIGAIPGFCDHYPARSIDPAAHQAFIRRVIDAGMGVRTVNADPGCFSCPGADTVEIQRQFSVLLQLATDLGAVGVVVGTGHPAAPAEVDRAIETTALGLGGLADLAADRGLPLLIEAPHVRQLCTTVDRSLALVDRLARANVQFVLDTSHVQASGQDPASLVPTYGSRLGHVHLRDAKGSDIHHALGDGDVDFGRFFDALDASHYEGHVTLELETNASTTDQKVAELVAGRALVETLWSDASGRQQASRRP